MISYRFGVGRAGLWFRRTAFAAAGAAVVGGILLPTGALDGGVRFCRSAWAGARIAAEYKNSETLAVGLVESETIVLKRQSHEKAAKILLDLFKSQGGVYVKAGQHIASLYYLLPMEVCL